MLGNENSHESGTRSKPKTQLSNIHNHKFTSELKLFLSSINNIIKCFIITIKLEYLKIQLKYITSVKNYHNTTTQKHTTTAASKKYKRKSD